MSDGFVLNEIQARRKPATWVEGPPRKSLLMGLSLRGKRTIPITTLRCDRCGFLESYAVD